MTKTKETLFKILTRLPFTVTLIAFFFMPDTVPVHFNMNNQVDRWGSKYELLILPAVILVIGIVFMFAAKYLKAKEEHGNNNYNVFITASLVILAIFNVLTYFTLYIAFMGIQDLDASKVDLFSLITLLFGFAFIIIGNVMPKVKMSHFLGLRTKWSMSSEEAWKKSQRFSGYSAIITGLIMIVLSFVLNGSVCLFAMLIALLVMAIADTVYSYFASK